VLEVLLHQTEILVQTHGRSSQELTQRIQEVVADSGIITGLCHLFVHHTSASLVVCENADPVVRSDMEAFLGRLVPDGDPMFRHRSEGPDDMAAHVRSMLTLAGLTLPVSGGRCRLGTWQGIYLWEHRTAPHQRRLTLTLWGHSMDGGA